MERQRDWQVFFDHTERQRNARYDLIEGLELPDELEVPVKALLHALDDLAQHDRTTKRLHNGTVTLSVKIDVIAQRLGRHENTARSYIKAAQKTPYLAVSESKHRSHTYLIRWQTIVDRLPCGEPNVRGSQIAGGTSGGGQEWGAIPTPPRGTNRGPIGPQTGVQNGVQAGPLKPGFKKPVLQGFETKEPVPRLVSAGVQRQFPAGFWPWWRAMVAARNLSDPADVDELYALGVHAGLYTHSERNRFNVFAQAAVDRRVAQTRGAIFRENVAYARWYSTCEADDEAERMIAQADRMEVGGEELPPRQIAAEDQIAQDEGIERQAQMAALRARMAVAPK